MTLGHLIILFFNHTFDKWSAKVYNVIVYKKKFEEIAASL